MASTASCTFRCLIGPSRLRAASSATINSRNFGFGTNWPQTSKRKKNANKNATQKAGKRREPSSPQPRSTTKFDKAHIPPACLLATASPYAYIARSAAVQNDLDPKQIYAHVSTDPLMQANGRHFCYHDEQTNASVTTNDDTTLLINEVAFLGRSNVGKSSLINAVMQKKLARTSKRPGRTQQAHYFALQDMINATKSQGDARIQQKPRIHGHLVDLPGYGYAVGPDAAVDAWQDDTQNLLLARRDSHHLRRVYLLVDARHGCLTFDFSIMRWLDEAGISYSIVLTKADAVTLPMRVKWVNQICMRYEHLVGSASEEERLDDDACRMHPIVHLTSANSELGLLELKLSIQEEFLGGCNDDEHGKWLVS
ncbi:hypothetical protein MPSEU_000942900 [Mayamaea pseudoterrestris]|nr:hypothetical protein MPSEU_000942900 [Mayamaea pseudoterrestris]